MNGPPYLLIVSCYAAKIILLQEAACLVIHVHLFFLMAINVEESALQKKEIKLNYYPSV